MSDKRNQVRAIKGIVFDMSDKDKDDFTQAVHDLKKISESSNSARLALIFLVAEIEASDEGVRDWLSNTYP